MARREQQRGDRQQSPRKRIEVLAKQLEVIAPVGEMGLEFFQALFEDGEWPHAAHCALRAVPRSVWLPLLEGDDRTMELIGELEIAFGDLPDHSIWPAAHYHVWVRLAIIALAKSWGFEAERRDPRGMPTHW